MDKKNESDARPPVPLIEPTTRVGDLIDASPAAFEALLEMGFTPLNNVVARRTVARFVSLEQAAAFRNISVEKLLTRLRRVVATEAGVDVVPESPTESESGFEADPDIPDLKGDVRVIGLVPCPVRGMLVERFDAFVQKLGSESGTRVAWWLAGEGQASRELKAWVTTRVARGATDAVPDVLIAVGTDLFFERECGLLARSSVFGRFPAQPVPAPALSPLEDPEGVLGLQFCGLFTLVCRPDRLPGGKLPRTWHDLTDPALEGEVALPTLTLPIVPDLVSALHGHLGDNGFARLAANVRATLHPAQASPRLGRGSVPGIAVVPLHFARTAEATGGVHVMPEDGAVAVAGYVGVRADAAPAAADLAAYLVSRTYLEPLWTHGSFFPNHGDLNIDLPGGKLITRPWSTLLDVDPALHAAKLVAQIEAGVGS